MLEIKNWSKKQMSSYVLYPWIKKYLYNVTNQQMYLNKIGCVCVAS